MSEDAKILEDIGQYKYGFHDPENYFFKSKKGLSREVVENISRMKGEPQWMLDFRLKGLEHFQKRPMPTWGADISGLDLDNIFYYVKPTEGQGKSWDDVPDTIKNTFDKLGIPEAERKFLAGVGAQYECLSGDTRVYTARGAVPIRDVVPGDVVFSFDEIKNEIISAPVRATVQKGERQVFEVKVGTRKIRATENHPFLVLENMRLPGRQHGRFSRAWKYLRDLKPGDLVAVAKKIPDVGQAHILEQPVVDITWRNNPVELPEETSVDLMWWLGLYIGDGFIHYHPGADKSRVEFAIPETDIPLRAEFMQVNSRLFGLAAADGDPYRLTMYSTVIARYLEANGFTGGALEKRVPDWVATLSHEQILAFLGGYVDADGYVRNHPKNHDVFLTSGNQALLQDVRNLAALCDLPTSNIHRFESKHPHDETRTIVGYRMEITGDFERLGCRSEQQLERFGKRKFHHCYSSVEGTTFRSHTNDYFGYAKIASITPAGVEDVFDIEVDGTHNFVAEGLIVHNSEMVYHSILEHLEKQGVIFLSIEDGLRQHPDLFREYFGTVIPIEDNKFAALNSAVWSGGSFVYVPKGVKVDLPLQAYFRLNTANVGQFERSLIIVDEGAYVHYTEGCTAPQYTTDSFHSGVIEIIVKRGARSRYTTIQNWSTNVYNLVTQRAKVFADGTHEWVDANLGCLTGDTQVLLSSGTKCIKDIEPGDEVFSTDVEMSLAPKQVVAKTYSGRQRVYRLQTENYREIKATANHPFLALIKDGKVYSTAWKRLDQLKVGDRVAISGNIPAYGVSRKFDFLPERGKKNITLPESSSEDLMWLLGVYIGDGYMEDSSVYFAVPPKDKAHSRLIEKLTDLFHVDYEIRKGVVRINAAQLVAWLRDLELSGNAHEKRVSRWVFALPQKQRIAFIEGYIAADGHRRLNHKNLSITSANRDLLEDVRYLAISCGLNPRKISRWSRREKKPLGKEEKEFTHYFLYFGEQEYEQPIYFSRVTSIEEQGIEDTWDIEINGTHNFIANGLIVHNSKVTMKYPSCYLMEPGAHGEMLSMAFAGPGQTQDAGSKMVHFAPNTTSKITSKSISKGGGRASYRGLLKVYKGAHDVKSNAVCDALLLDPDSRSDTYPYIEIDEDDVTIGHEASVSKVGEEQLFYLMSRGLSQEEATTMVVSGFIEPLVKELPMEYAVEMNRLIQLQMEGSIG